MNAYSIQDKLLFSSGFPAWLPLPVEGQVPRPLNMEAPGKHLAHHS